MSKNSAEKYPILVQVVGPHLMVLSKDFDLWIAEKYEPELVGQTELLIRKLRKKIEARLTQLKNQGRELPSLTTVREMDFETPELLTASQASRLLKISRVTLWRMTEEGKIKFELTPGGHRRFSREEIESLKPLTRKKETETRPCLPYSASPQRGGW